MKIILALLCSALGWAQSVALSVSPAGVLPGGTATVSLAYTDPTPTANLAGLQWQLNLPSALSLGVPPLITAIGVAAAAGKVITTNPANGYTILVGSGCPSCTPPIALNTSAIQSGLVANVTVSVATTAAAGPLTIAFGTGLPLLGADINGSAVALTGSSVTLNVISKYDINGDGVVNAADVLAALSIALRIGNGTCSVPFVTVGDGKCNISDVLMVVRAALGQIPL